MVVTPRAHRARRPSGSAASPSRSIQNTYSQARSRLGRDSSLRMLRPCSARTRRTASSVPGSLRTATTSVVRRSVGGSTSGGTRHPDGQHQEARPVVREVADVVGQDLQPEQGRGAGREDGGGATLAGSRDGLAGTGRVVGREELPGRARGTPRPGRGPGCASRPARCPRGAGPATPPGTAGPERRPRRRSRARARSGGRSSRGRCRG